jgi:uncharacterized Zn finger protein
MTLDGWLPERWLAPITEASELRTQLRKGRVLARKGCVGDLEVRPGLVTAIVKSEGGGGASVKIRQPPIADAWWDDALDRLAQQAGHAAALLAGRMSRATLSVFEDVGIDLFPFDLRDLANFCSCLEQTTVCTHAAATHLVLADAMAADPFVLFEFRGRPKEQLLDGLRARRSGPAGPTVEEPEAAREDTEDGSALLDGYFDRGPLPAIAFHFQPGNGEPQDDGLAVIRALGPGPSAVPPEAVALVLAPLVRIARQRVERLTEQVADVDTSGRDPGAAGGLDDLLVAAARQAGHLTSSGVAELLHIPQQEARRYLQWLVQEGRLLQVGRARGTRYEPPPLH